MSTLMWCALAYVVAILFLLLDRWATGEMTGLDARERQRERAARWREYTDPTYPRTNFTLTMTPVVAQPRKLATWSLEAAEDMRRLWGEDVGLNLLAAAEREMEREVRREMFIAHTVECIIREVFGPATVRPLDHVADTSGFDEFVREHERRLNASLGVPRDLLD